MSFDDLYNNFKIVEQEIKKTVISNSNSSSQNMAFVSTPGSTNEVDTANKKMLWIVYALTSNPTIYVSLIEQFWQTATVETINDREQQLTVTVDGKRFAITEASLRRHLQLRDADGISSLPNTKIFDQLTLIGKTRTRTRRMDIRIPQSNVPTSVADEAIIKEMHDGLVRATTTASSLEAEQGSGNIAKTQAKATPSGPSSPRTSLEGGYTPGSDEGSKKLNELTDLYTKLFDKVTSLENDLKQTKQTYGKALTKLVKKVKQLKDRLKSTTKRRKARMVVFDDEEDLRSEDTTKQGRMSEEFKDVHLTPTKVTPDKEQSSSEAQLGVLSAAKILADATREIVSTADITMSVSTVGFQEEPATTKMKKRQERAGFEAAIRLQEQLDEEERQMIARNAEAAQIPQEEFDDAKRKRIA
ncbi:hypothetical protein Tco_0658690 [Tanacetum coccineum]